MFNYYKQSPEFFTPRQAFERLQYDNPGVRVIALAMHHTNYNDCVVRAENGRIYAADYLFSARDDRLILLFDADDPLTLEEIELIPRAYSDEDCYMSL
jgi:hypothetical protein